MKYYQIISAIWLAAAFLSSCAAAVQQPTVPVVEETLTSQSATQIAFVPIDTPTLELQKVTDTDIPAPTPTWTITPSPSPSPSPTMTPEVPVRFAVIGDYGLDSAGLSAVAALVKSWSPDFIVTTGDNNYPEGSAETIDENIGKHFHEYIGNYAGAYGEGAEENRFFPTLGNHDWYTQDAQPYFDYFDLPGNERYYSITRGPVEIFALNSDSNEPDGVGRSSVQGQWLQDALSGSNAPWQIVVMHHAPYSSGTHGGIDWAQWPYEEWGADAVLAGHDHTYERLEFDGIPYFVNGAGGSVLYNFEDIHPNSQVRYNAEFGAMLVEVTSTIMSFQFVTTSGVVVDQVTVHEKP